MKQGTQYFLESNNKIRGFLETKAEFNQNNEKSKLIYHKIGHALHVLNPVFQSATYNDATKVSIFIIHMYNGLIILT